jgi:glycosyltransferase involved in cell wall biosynthesis
VKILVFAHRLEIGGTQTNAIELAAALRDSHGHDMVLFATPGPAIELAKEKRLRFLPAPDSRFHPSPARVRALREAVRRERPDLIHVWDWWQCLEAYYAVHLMMRVPMVVTDMMMHLTRVLPRELPTTFGTPELVDQAKAAGWRRATLMLPPVDVRCNAPDVVDRRLFRASYGIRDDEVTVVAVSRLSISMKLESLLGTMDAVRKLGRDQPMRYLIVGDGAARAQLSRAAEEANAHLGRRVVILTGAMVDPRPAYAAADIVVGMGGSSLRGMAFGKPVVVVGERGFSSVLNPTTAATLLYKGMYGHGDGSPIHSNVASDIGELAQDPLMRKELGAFSREFVTRHFSLEGACARLAALCAAAVEEVPGVYVSAMEGLRTAAVYLRKRGFLIPSRDAVLMTSTTAMSSPRGHDPATGEGLHFSGQSVLTADTTSCPGRLAGMVERSALPTRGAAPIQ